MTKQQKENKPTPKEKIVELITQKVKEATPEEIEEAIPLLKKLMGNNKQQEEPHICCWNEIDQLGNRFCTTCGKAEQQKETVYRLKNLRIVQDGRISIAENSKEDIKKLMGWDEKQWEEHTETLEEHEKHCSFCQWCEEQRKEQQKETEKMNCYSCGSRMEEGVELIVSKGKTIPQQVMKCNNCGKAIVSSGEYERVRKEIEQQKETDYKKEPPKMTSKYTNPAHFCMNGCGKYLGHRGFCSEKCHDNYYDENERIEETKPSEIAELNHKLNRACKDENFRKTLKPSPAVEKGLEHFFKLIKPTCLYIVPEEEKLLKEALSLTAKEQERITREECKTRAENLSKQMMENIGVSKVEQGEIWLKIKSVAQYEQEILYLKEQIKSEKEKVIDEIKVLMKNCVNPEYQDFIKLICEDLEKLKEVE